MLLHLSPYEFTARVVVLMTVGQFNASFNVRRLTGCVGLSSVVKSSHDVPRKPRSPFLGLGWSAPRKAEARKAEVNDAISSGCYWINLTSRQLMRRSYRYKNEKPGNPFARNVTKRNHYASLGHTPWHVQNINKDVELQHHHS